VILIPEIPYDVEKISNAIRQRSRKGKRFSIVAVAEGALNIEDAASFATAEELKRNASSKESQRKKAKSELIKLTASHAGNTQRLATQLEELTGLESRLTILGHLQRGGIPSSADRLLATRLGTAAVNLINQNHYGVLVAARGEFTEPVPLKDVAGRRKLIPADHPWIQSARDVGTNLGDT
jgi:6-phosphofructokinase 1